MESKEKNSDKGLADLLKDFTSTGLAAFFMTEDSIRNYLRDKKLPKELAGLLLDVVSKKRDELYGMFAKEFGRMLSKVDITAEIEKFLENHSVQLEAKVSFEPKDQPGNRTKEAHP